MGDKTYKALLPVGGYCLSTQINALKNPR